MSAAVVSRDQNRGSQGKVLIIDDEEPIRIALKRTLGRLGFETSDAGTAEAGLAAIATYNPDVIFLDLRMPGMDGHTFLRRLRAQAGADPPPVIVISGQGNIDDVIEVLRWGAADYLRKPWNLTELMSAVTRCMEMRRPSGDADAAGLAASSPPVAANDGRARRFAEIQQKLRQGEIVLPAVPAVLTKLGQLVDDPKSSMDDIAITIESDSRIAADILRLANSPHYVHLGRAANAKAAITRLGLRHVYNLVQTIALQGFSTVTNPSYQKQVTSVWRRSVARAVAMRALCDILDPVPGGQALNGDTAYLIGLMADVGASLLLWVVSERKGDALTPADINDTVTALDTVRRCHEDLGKAMLTRWQFDPVITSTVALHHRDTPPVVGAAWWCLFVLGDHVATALVGENDPISDAPNALVIERCAAEFRIPRLVLTRFGAELRNEFESILRGISGAA